MKKNTLYEIFLTIHALVPAIVFYIGCAAVLYVLYVLVRSIPPTPMLLFIIGIGMISLVGFCLLKGITWLEEGLKRLLPVPEEYLKQRLKRLFPRWFHEDVEP